MRIGRVIFLALISVFCIFVFRLWFTFSPLSSGDWIYNFPESIKSFTVWPYIWQVSVNNGFGGNVGPLLGLSLYYFVTSVILSSTFHISWEIIEKIVWFWPFLVLSIFSSWYFFRRVFPKNNLYLLPSIIFLLNTYALMLVGGGQMGVALGYAVAPLVLALFLPLVTNEEFVFKNSVLAGMVFALQVLFDIRIAYISVFMVFMYTLFFFVLLIQKEYMRELAHRIRSVVLSFLIVGLLTFLLHFFWIAPLILFRNNPFQQVGEAYTSVGSVRFFSFARFSDAFSLLHPNWPENIFGKVYFMRPEFLIIPILAYIGFVFFKQEKDRKQKFLFFGLLGLVGAFLSKGANEPFGDLYLWLFKTVPGFKMFRDSTKFYLLTAVSYSVLIPLSLSLISQKMAQVLPFIYKKNIKKSTVLIGISALFIIFWFITIRQALLGQLGGTFKPHFIQEYSMLKDFLNTDYRFSRTLWIPGAHRFGFYSSTHPAVSADLFFREASLSGILKQFDNPQAEKLLQYAAVKYVIVPYDSEGEFFLKDRKYDERKHQKTIQNLENIPWLIKRGSFGRITVFEVPNPKDHFWIVSGRSNKIEYKNLSPTNYEVTVYNASKGEQLVFSEAFDKNWITRSEGKIISSKPYKNRFNSFFLPKNGNYNIVIQYAPQIWVNAGLFISFVSLSISVLYFVL